MPKKGHTCCVLGCTVNSKKTELADGRRPRFFCFPHEKKRPHLRRAWLALTRRTEASTNTRVCEFHFVDGKPSNVNPHPILNMGMEATKMQKRAQELRQQKELRKLILQQQMVAAGQLLPGQPLPPGLTLSWKHEGGPLMVGQDSLGMIAGLPQGQLQLPEFAQGQDALNIPNLDNPYEDHVRLAAGMNLDDTDDLPSQIANYGNPLPLVMHDRDQTSNDGNESMLSNGSLAQELQPPEEDCEEDDDSPNQSLLIPTNMDQESQPSLDALPIDCSKITPQNANSENPSPIPPLQPSSEAASPLQPPSEAASSSNNMNPASILATSDNDTKPPAGIATPPSTAEGALDNHINSLTTELNGCVDSILSSTPKKENGHESETITKSTFPMFRNQNTIQQSINMIKNAPLNHISIQQSSRSPPLKVPSWQVKVNGTASVPSALEVPAAPVAKKPRKRKSTPSQVKTTLNNSFNSLTIPRVMGGIQVQATPKPQSNVMMSRQAVESLKSDILENLRAEFLTEMQQESESNKQLKAEMETVRLQTRQELAQMRVELHALWGENQRLRAQVESLLQDKETNRDNQI